MKTNTKQSITFTSLKLLMLLGMVSMSYATNGWTRMLQAEDPTTAPTKKAQQLIDQIASKQSKLDVLR